MVGTGSPGRGFFLKISPPFGDSGSGFKSPFRDINGVFIGLKEFQGLSVNKLLGGNFSEGASSWASE
jgi:hypothetical protein